MSPRVELGLWGLTGVLGVFAYSVWRVPTATPAPVNAVAPIATIESPDTARIQRSVRNVIASDPFRLVREPSPLPFRPFGDRVVQSAAAVPPQPKPQLVLRGIVGGPPWEALIEGLPGKTGPVIVRPGEKVGDLVIRTIVRDTVVVQGMDTTWRLAMVRVWQ